MKKAFSLLVFFIVLFSISGVSSYITVPEIDNWYKDIAKPSFNPPNWVFAPVWITLYAMIAVSGWLAWEKLSGDFAQKIRSREMKIFASQMAANFIWSVLFFGMHQVFIALIDVVILLVLIGININIFKQTSKAAAWLLVPYFCWVAFASTLNLSIFVLN